MRLGLPVPERSRRRELMEQPGVDPGARRDAYRVLRRVNRQFFGGVPVLRRELRRWLEEEPREPGSTVRILDVAGGSGDLAGEAAAWLAKRGLSPVAMVADLDDEGLRMALAGGLGAARADAFRLPIAGASIDLVVVSKFAHHVDDEAMGALLKELGRVTGSTLLVLDLRRSWLAWVGFWLWSRVFTRNRLVRVDGPISVRRGFLPEELEGHARSVGDEGLRWEVRRHPWFQLALVARRRGAG